MMHSFLMSSGGARLRLIEWLLEKFVGLIISLYFTSFFRYQPQILLRQSSVPSASNSPRSASESPIKIFK